MNIGLDAAGQQATALLSKANALIAAITPDQAEGLMAHLDAFAQGANLDLAAITKETVSVETDVAALVKQGAATLVKLDDAVQQFATIVAMYRAGITIMVSPAGGKS